jgi:hypothetical protein
VGKAKDQPSIVESIRNSLAFFDRKAQPSTTVTTQKVIRLEAMALDSATPGGEQMKSHVVLLGRVLEDLSIQCCVSTTHDYKTVVSRVEEEGLSFLTITLPTFAKDLERALDQGFVDSRLFCSFKKSRALPAFLGGLTSQIFDVDSGVLLDEPSVDAIRGIRQACYLYKKLEHPCSDARMKAAYRKYVETDDQVMMSMMRLTRDDFRDYRRIATLVLGGVLRKAEKAVREGSLIPKHGPGATADRLRGNAKYDNRLWTVRLEEYFPARDFLFPSVNHYLSGEQSVTWLAPEQEMPVRVIAVPKTLKTPRIIAIEPTYQQYVQQALMEFLVEKSERDYYLQHFIGFTDQEPNKTMACHGSAAGDLATLDLSEASDRVSIQHVEHLLEDTSLLSRAVFAVRSSKAEIPGYGVETIAKYASMGSALTFPLEAMVFLTIILLGIERENGTPVTRKTLQGLMGKVRVYGDDIIVPVQYAESVSQALADFGLVVNVDKSFWTGKFRESCGGDYYAGRDVTVVKCVRDLPTNRTHVSEINSAVSLRNQLNELGYWRTVEYLDHCIERLIPFPTVLPGSPGLGKHSLSLDFDVQRVCPHLQRPLVRAAVIDGRIPDSDVSGTGALLKYFLKRGSEPFADVKHLERAGRPDAVNMKLRWITPY